MEVCSSLIVVVCLFVVFYLFYTILMFCMINACNRDLGFYEYNISAVMDSSPSVQ